MGTFVTAFLRMLANAIEKRVNKMQRDRGIPYSPGTLNPSRATSPNRVPSGQEIQAATVFYDSGTGRNVMLFYWNWSSWGNGDVWSA